MRNSSQSILCLLVAAASSAAFSFPFLLYFHSCIGGGCILKFLFIVFVTLEKSLQQDLLRIFVLLM